MKYNRSYAAQIGRQQNRQHDDDAKRNSARAARRHPVVLSAPTPHAQDALSRALLATVALGLLTAPVAQAAMAGPLQAPRLPAGGGRRQLQQNDLPPCLQQIRYSYPTLKPVNMTAVLAAPHAVQSLITPLQWRQVTVNACGGQLVDPQVRLSYSFDTLPAAATSGRFVNPQRLSAAQRALRVQTLNEVSAHANVVFTEVPGTQADANIYMFVGDSLTAAGAEGGEESNLDGNHTYAAWLRGTTDSPSTNSDIPHEIGHALQLTHPFANTVNPSVTGVHLPIDGWNDNRAATVMSYSNSLCYPVPTHYGPLDMGALRTLYGAPPEAAGNGVYSLDDLSGVGGLQTEGGNNTWVAASSLPVFMNLGNGGNDVSVVLDPVRNVFNQSAVSLSPIGTMNHGDIADTAGGTLLGNGGDNRLRGSDNSDVIGGRGGNDHISTGAGQDTVWLEALAGNVVVDDFDVNQDRIATAFNAAPPTVSAIQSGGQAATQLVFAEGPTLVLLGVQPAQLDLQRLLTNFTPSPWPHQGGNCTLPQG